MNHDRRYVLLRELAEIYDLRLSWLYEMTRNNRLPGMRRVGSMIRVSVDEFDQAVKEGAVS